MPTIYGEHAEITGSLQVDGDIDLGSGDDDISMDGSDNTFFLDGTNNRVGIGTSTPAYKLHVNASAADTTSQITAYFRSADTDYSRISVDSTANADTQISFMNNGSTKWSIGNEATRDSFHITTGYGPFDPATDPIVVGSNGTVSFNGNAYFSGGMSLGTETLSTSDTGGAVDTGTPVTALTNAGGILSVTLADASYTGQKKIILCTGYSNSYSLTVAVTSASWAGGSGTMTFPAAGTFVTLIWVNSAWWVIGGAGVSYS
tara:strand:- start:3236 stop:4015 length:780 start_codon:yes stop_codon:yes gene_type:complete